MIEREAYMKLSIIIPAYNEEKYLPALLKKVEKVKLPGMEKEIVVVDDKSTDNTGKFLRELQKKKKEGYKIAFHEKNKGKGAAIRTGIKYCTGEFIIIQDADLEYDPEDYKKLMKPFIEDDADVVYGSRYSTVKKNKGKVEYYQSFYLGGKMLTLLTNLLYNAKITDEATCYKVFRADILKGINLKCNRFEFCPEVTAKVRKKGYKIVEVPISYYPRKISEGKKIRWKDGVEAIWALLKYRFVD